jgi:hypothetical protein
MVGVPVLGLLGILQAGRDISAPLSIGGDWTLELDPAPHCAKALARPLAFNISQSGTQALVTLNDSHATTLDAALKGATLTAKSLTAKIAGKADARTMEGTVSLEGCAPLAFKAVRQASKKRGA